jgi:hypothetical protein
VNFVEKDCIGFQSSYVNIDKAKFTGLQYGLFNQDGEGDGLLVGWVNVTKDMHGVQIGLLNMTDTMKGLQIGIANIISTGGIPFLPIVNWRF